MGHQLRASGARFQSLSPDATAALHRVQDQQSSRSDRLEDGRADRTRAWPERHRGTRPHRLRGRDSDRRPAKPPPSTGSDPQPAALEAFSGQWHDQELHSAHSDPDDPQQTQLGAPLHHPRQKARQFAAVHKQVVGPFDLNRKAPLLKPLHHRQGQRQAKQAGLTGPLAPPRQGSTDPDTTWRRNPGAPPLADSPALVGGNDGARSCLLYTSPSPRDRQKSRMPSSA